MERIVRVVLEEFIVSDDFPDCRPIVGPKSQLTSSRLPPSQDDCKRVKVSRRANTSDDSHSSEGNPVRMLSRSLNAISRGFSTR